MTVSAGIALVGFSALVLPVLGLEPAADRPGLLGSGPRNDDGRLVGRPSSLSLVVLL